MKKIIYSFVIMIAAGSLFTSCVTNTEPQGIKDIREAKANYLDALAELRKADAAVRNADAEFRKAQVAYENAVAKLKELEVAKQQAQNDADIAKIIADAKVAAVNAEKALAEAEEGLQEALWNIAVKSKELTQPEKDAITAYATAYQEYIAKLQEIRELEERIATDDMEVEPSVAYAAWVEEAKEDVAAAQAAYDATKAAQEKAQQAFIDNLPDSGKAYTEAKAILAEHKERVKELKYDSASVEKDWQVFKTTEVSDAITGFSSDLVDWFTEKAAIPAPFIMNYKAQLPDNRQVFNLLKRYWNEEIEAESMPFNGLSFVEDEEGFWLLANYYSSLVARTQIFGNYSSEVKSLQALIDALNRDKVVDPSVAGFDTTGMSKAVAAAEKEYNAVLDTLVKGVMEYPGVKESIAAYNQAVADSAKYKDALDKAVDSLKNSWATLCKLYSSAGSHSELFDYFFPTYASNFEGAVRNFAEARYNYFGVAADSLDYIKVLGVNETSFDYELKTVAISKLNKEFTAIKKDTKYYSRFLPDKVWESKEQAQMVGYNVVLMNLLPKYDGKLVRDTEHDFVTYGFEKVDFFFSTPIAFDKKGNAKDWDVYKYAKKDKVADYYEVVTSELYTPLDLIAAEEAVTEAKESYYKNIYCYFWGISFGELKGSGAFDNANVCFVDPAKDSLNAKAFSLATFNVETPIVNFNFDEGDGYNAETGEFFYKGHKVGKRNPVDATDDYELYIVEDIINSNLSKAGKNTSWVKPGATLAAQVLYKQSMLAYYNDQVGTDSVADALAALNDISEDIAAAYVAAIERQRKESEPFFNFLTEFIGAKTFGYLTTQLDSALTKAAEYIPAYVKGEYDSKSQIVAKMAMDVVKEIAAGNLTSKDALVLLFDQFMCGEFNSKFIFKTGDITAAFIDNIGYSTKDEQRYIWKGGIVSSKYVTAYIAVQTGDAFVGPVLRGLVADVLKAFIAALEQDEKVKDIEKYLSEANVVESLIFGVVKPAKLTIGELSKFISEISDDTKGIEISTIFPILKVVAPEIIPYLYTEQTLDGIISTLERKWFKEWAEAWQEYSITKATIEAELETIEDLNAILAKFVEEGDLSYGITAYITACKNKIAAAESKLKEAKGVLAIAEAGPSIKETHLYEWYQDQIARLELELAAAAKKLETAEAAYKQVLANHGLDE